MIKLDEKKLLDVFDAVKDPLLVFEEVHNHDAGLHNHDTGDTFVHDHDVFVPHDHDNNC